MKSSIFIPVNIMAAAIVLAGCTGQTPTVTMQSAFCKYSVSFPVDWVTEPEQVISGTGIYHLQAGLSAGSASGNKQAISVDAACPLDLVQLFTLCEFVSKDLGVSLPEGDMAACYVGHVASTLLNEFPGASLVGGIDSINVNGMHGASAVVHQTSGGENDPQYDIITAIEHPDQSLGYVVLRGTVAEADWSKYHGVVDDIIKSITFNQ